MTNTQPDLLSEVESILQQPKAPPAESLAGIPSNAQPPSGSEQVEKLVLPVQDRPKMPYTKDKYIVREDPHLVAWERETRLFLRHLSPRHGHRVSAVMVYEWATGDNVARIMASGGQPSPELRKISKVLRHYFGKPYSTWIMGRKVPRAYKVPSGYYIKRHRPLTLELWFEYQQKVLEA